VVLGQNAELAWGFTNTGPDVQDLYIEQLDPGDPTRVRTPDGWARMESFPEIIRVKGRADVAFTARRTRHGPVISDAGTMPDVLGPREQPRYVLALRWTALDEDSDSIGVSLAMQSSGSVAAFVDAAQGLVAPMQNMVVADRSGHIGFVAPGRVPVRRADNDLKGLAPAPGWLPRYDWEGTIPAAQTPREFDPERGFIATANQRVTPAGYPYLVSNDWALPYRHQRIEQLLRARARHSLNDLAALQGDVKSLAVPNLLPWLLRAESNHPLAAAAQTQLAGFDGTMAPDRAAPLIFWAWQRELARGVFMDDTGTELWNRSLAGRTFQDALERVLMRDDTSWCDERSTPATETCAQQSGAALTRALTDLSRRLGEDVTTWQWGRLHQARSEHRPFSHVKWLAPWFELRAPVGGDTHTVNVSRVGLRPDRTTGELFLNEHAASLRALYDVADRSQSRVMHSTGQSGNLFSPQYRSFVAPWQEVRYVPLWPAAGTALQVLTVKPVR
jgi:penicillin G amidase